VTKSKKSVASSLFELVVIVATAVVLALAIQAFVVKPYRIPSASMEPTLRVNQRVLVNRAGTHLGFSPGIGDIIVFHPPKNYQQCADPNEGQSASGNNGARACDVAQARPSGETFIKRVVGLPGDHISIRSGHVVRNGVQEKDSYIAQCDGIGSCDFPATIVVPRNDYYMMGDNRGQSDDSRFWGPVPKSWIIGRAFFTYWPPGRIGFL
jgi:signal peptidase I